MTAYYGDRLGPNAPLEGQRIGPYRLMRELGRGGMGTVYLAARSDGQFEQRVAIKLLRRGLDTEDILVRFRAERQILASLNHPNIARLLDGGAHSDGRPFLVMELVEGVPITEFCDLHCCTIGERLRLLVLVANAVQHAHRNLIVHRDIKPSNIIVTRPGSINETGSAPKLLDFGIAKLLDDPLTPDQSPRTRPGKRMMTPEYASPEQLRGEQVTTASDVYQLGVLLYELLVGRRPHLADETAQEASEWLVREKQPTVPSEAIGAPPKLDDPTVLTPQELARLRRTDPRRLRTRLRGDLDTIVMKAMHPETERRYASAGELADDIERYLAGLPVAARPDTLAYRARKFARRRPGVVLAGLVVAMAAGGYMGTLRVHADRLAHERNVAQAERQRAEIERDRAEVERARAEVAQAVAEAERAAASAEHERAESEAARAQASQRIAEIARRQAEADRDRAAMEAVRSGQVTEFLVSLFETADPSRSPGSDVTARELLDRGVERADALAGQPDVQAELSLTMARAYHTLGLYDAALTLVDRVLAIHQERGDQALPLAEALNERGDLLLRAGDYSAAEAPIRQALSIRREQLGAQHPDVARSLNSLGLLFLARGDYDAAEPLQREALAVRRSVLGDEHPDLARSLNDLGRLLRARGDLDGAEILYREALAMERKLLGDEHPDLVRSLNNLGRLLRAKGDLDEAEALYREALAMGRSLLGDEHPDVAVSLNNLGVLLRAKGDYAAAEPLYREALAMERRLLGDEHPNVAISLNNLGVLRRAMGDLAGAEAFYREALAMERKLLGDEHPAVARSLNNLGRVLGAQGDLDGAEVMYREALAIGRSLLGDEHPDLARSLGNLGMLLHEKGDHEAAIPLLTDALNMRRSLLGDLHPAVAQSLTNLAIVLQARGDLDAAEAHYREALSLNQELHGEEHPDVTETRALLESLLQTRAASDTAASG